MSQTPLRSLVAACLPEIHKSDPLIGPAFHLDLFTAAGTIGAEAIAGSGVGLDHFRGERVLAAMLMREQVKGVEHRLSAAISDRRTFLSGWSSIKGGFNRERFSLDHAALTSVTVKTGILSNRVTLNSPGGAHQMVFTEFTKSLGEFYHALCTQIPVEQRIEPETAFLSGSDADPTGAVAALNGLWGQDDSATWMLQTVAGQLKAGQIGEPIARDLASRALLAHRSTLSGPGMKEGGWVSPMAAADFGSALSSIFGAPAAHSTVQSDMFCLDFNIDPDRDYIGAAMNALGGAARVGLGLALSPGKLIAKALMKKQPLRQLRVFYGDRAGYCGYRLQSGGIPLCERDSLMAHRLHQALIQVAHRVLQGRVQLGWQTPYAELFS